MRWWKDDEIEKLVRMMDVQRCGWGFGWDSNGAVIARCANRYIRRNKLRVTVEGWQRLCSTIAKRCGYTHHMTEKVWSLRPDYRLESLTKPAVSEYVSPQPLAYKDQITARMNVWLILRNGPQNKQQQEMYRELEEARELLRDINRSIKLAKDAIKGTV